MNILGIETSCDETAAAVVADGKIVLSNIIASQAQEHSLYGGVVPEIASRRHIENIDRVVYDAMKQSNLSVNELDAVAVTNTPGLIGALLVGVNFAKAYSFVISKPLIAVHHIRGHIASLYIEYDGLKPPFICLVASGGHSHIVMVNGYTKFKVLGKTIDDAAGEAFDKVARTLGLGYPGGPAVAKAALQGNHTLYKLPTPNAQGKYNVSFSGLKTAVLNIVNKAKMKGEQLDFNSLAASFQQKAADILIDKLTQAAIDHKVNTVCIAGGVAANTLLRQGLQKACQEQQKQLFLPSVAYCGDNAAMIAAAAYYEYKNGNVARADLNAYATTSIE